MEFKNFPQPTRPTSFSNLTSFKYSVALSQPSEPVILQDSEPSTSTSNQQQTGGYEEEVFNELTRILFECLENVDTEHKGLLLRKIFLELEKESQLEKFIVENLKHSRVKVISELFERYSESLQGMIDEDELTNSDDQETVSRGFKDDLSEADMISGSIKTFSRKLEKFKVKTINIEGGVVKK